MSATIRETCGCGSDFTVTTGHMNEAERAAREWREGHRHAESVGICGDRTQPLLMADMEIEQQWCELRAGHAGAHSSGDGRHWIKATDLPPDATPAHHERGDQRGAWLCAKCGHGSQEHGMVGHPAYLCVADMTLSPTTPSTQESR